MRRTGHNSESEIGNETAVLWYGLVEVDWWKGVPELRKSVEVKVTNDIGFG